jgi:CRISPR-associated endonuclease Csn1
MNSKPESAPPATGLTFGFDIGIASVGWAVLAPDRIVALGVRAFDKAETAKEGESLNLIRRTARLMRRRLQRRAWRLARLARLLKREGLIADTAVFTPAHPARASIWKLRTEALDRALPGEEWARVIYHLCKHRGFHWLSRAEAKQAEGDAKSESGRVKQGLAATKKLMDEKGYRTAAEMVLAEFPDAQRNKAGDYGKAISRALLANELKLLFERQRVLGNPHATTTLEEQILGRPDERGGIFWAQKPALSGAKLLCMLGKCTFEKNEYRAPKASFTAERHVWLTRLNNLRIFVDGTTRPLSAEERAIALPMPYEFATDLTFKRLRGALVKAGVLPESFKFASLSYPSQAQQAAGKAKDPEGATLVKVPAWHALRTALAAHGLEAEWRAISGAALAGQPAQLDQIGWVLSVFKDDDEVAAELAKLPLPNTRALVDALLDVRFDKFHALSLQALSRIVPLMEAGARYDEACAQAGYHHSQPFEPGAGDNRLLPPLYSGRCGKTGRMKFNEDLEVPRNPVVLRALNQARKVLNAMVRTYGSPREVRIEMARDLSRPKSERDQITKEQEQYRARNETDKAMFAEQFGRPPKGPEFEKWRLYREQQGKCAYSIEPLDLHRLLEDGYVEIDHALPWSRSFDNSKNNKVLVLSRENRNKGNRTPYEYLDGASDSARWLTYVAFVQSNKAYRLAKRSRLLRKDFSKNEARDFRERNLNDTRYICRFFKNYVERYLKLADDSESNRCVVVSGQLTAFLRARWGLLKVREENDRHHALDASVVGACTHAMVKRLSDYARRKELQGVRDGFVDIETGEIVDVAAFARLERHFPEPWPLFRDELGIRLKLDDREEMREALARLGNYPHEALLAARPLFVSRAPQRRNGGAAHKETIYSQPDRLKAEGSVTQKVALRDLSLKDIDSLIDPHRNAALYAAIRQRLEAHGGKADKAFAADKPLRKPDRNGDPTGPIVRSVTMVINKLSGVEVRGGIAKNDTMLRVDVFAKGGRHFLIPVYVHHRVKGLPSKAIIQGKDESEWTEVDDTFAFLHSLHPNDLVCVSAKNGAQLGYFSSCDRSTGTISLWTHDRNEAAGTGGLIRGIGVKTADRIDKLHVDTLGNTFLAPPETRRGLA